MAIQYNFVIQEILNEISIQFGHAVVGLVLSFIEIHTSIFSCTFRGMEISPLPRRRRRFQRNEEVEIPFPGTGSGMKPRRVKCGTISAIQLPRVPLSLSLSFFRPQKEAQMFVLAPIQPR